MNYLKSFYYKIFLKINKIIIIYFFILKWFLIISFSKLILCSSIFCSLPFFKYRLFVSNLIMPIELKFSTNGTQTYNFADVTGQFIKWNAMLQTNNTNYTPILNDVVVNYEGRKQTQTNSSIQYWEHQNGSAITKYWDNHTPCLVNTSVEQVTEIYTPIQGDQVNYSVWVNGTNWTSNSTFSDSNLTISYLPAKSIGECYQVNLTWNRTSPATTIENVSVSYASGVVAPQGYATYLGSPWVFVGGAVHYFYPNGTEIESDNIITNSTGWWSGTNLTVTGLSSVGGYSIVVNLSNGTNHTSTQTYFGINTPNLKVTSANITYSSPCSTSSCSITVRIYNDGNVATPVQFTSKIYVDGVELCSQTIAVMAAGASDTTLSCNAIGLSATTHTIRGVADTTDVIEESRENDNESPIVIDLTPAGGGVVSGGGGGGGYIITPSETVVPSEVGEVITSESALSGLRILFPPVWGVPFFGLLLIVSMSAVLFALSLLRLFKSEGKKESFKLPKFDIGFGDKK